MLRIKTNPDNTSVVWERLTVYLILLGLMLPQAGFAAEKSSGQDNLRTKHYYYQAFNHRDPFQSLVSGDFEEGSSDLINIQKVSLVGVLSGGMEKYAMLEDKNGIGHILKVGDPIRNGSIVSVSERSLIARVVSYGQTNSVTLILEGEKEKGD